MNIATLGLGIGSMFVGADNWGESMDVVEAFRGNPDPSVAEKIGGFLSDQTEVFDEVFINPELGPDESPVDNAQQAAEIATVMFAGGLIVTVASGNALRK